MKKISILILFLFVFSMSLIGQSIKIVNTSYETSLLSSIGVTNYSLVTTDDWYFSKDGIDVTAKKMVDKLPTSESVILYGISLGGTVSRRMTQIAKDNGKNVKGYIAQSSPLSGDRLTNTVWAAKSLALLGGYLYLGSEFLLFGLPLDEVQTFLSRGGYDIYEGMGDETRKVIEKIGTISGDKKIDRNNRQSVIEKVTLPLLDTIFGSLTERGATDYFSSVFTMKNNNVKDLDPTGTFMVNTMNCSSSLQKEISGGIKRAFIVSTNGNIYESSAWTTVKPVLNSYIDLRDSMWAQAKKHWLLFPVYAVYAGMAGAAVATLEDLPKVWSKCVSGSTDYSTNDGFVPVNDTFQGKKLQMVAPNMRTDFDRVITCDKVSHVDYSSGLYTKLDKGNISGRTYSRKDALKQQRDSLLVAYNFVKK